jgi:NAD(P)-dependent dehydrogenase (short-subunit alcohol dehydrogenase family)
VSSLRYNDPMANHFDGKTALVTGAASGIGRATAVAFAQAGADLVLCDVDEKGLAETERMARELGRNVLSRKVDVSDARAMQAFADEVHQKHDALDILVNNAGVGLGGGFLDTSLEDWKWILGINVWGVIHGCHAFVPRMVEKKRGGHVVIVSSAAGYSPSAMLVAYSTTKFAVLGLAENLRLELAPHGIGVTAICPGIINTPITRNSRLRGKAAEPGAQARMQKFYEKRNYGPEKVAEGILAAVAKNRGVAPISPEAWGFYLLKRLSPALFDKVSHAIAKKAVRDAARG